MGPNGSEKFKTLLLLQIAAKNVSNLSWIFPQWSSQYDVWIFEILSFRFVTFFETFQITIAASGKIKSLKYLEQNWVKFGTRG